MDDARGADAGPGPTADHGPAVRAWRDALHGWALPQEILANAPADPYALPPSLISTATVDPRQTPTGHAVLDALEPGDTLLDVGCGAGRISGTFCTDHHVVGVEPRETLAEVAREVGIDVRVGRWPAMAPEVGRAPVVLCTHVLYDVDDPAPFLVALTGAARRRVVLEVTAVHPWDWITPLYRRFHHLDRPAGPTAEMLLDVVAEVDGIEAEVQRWTRPRPRHADLSDLVAHARRMLCLGPEADPDIERALLTDVVGGLVEAEDGSVGLADQALATIWWDLDG